MKYLILGTICVYFLFCIGFNAAASVNTCRFPDDRLEILGMAAYLYESAVKNEDGGGLDHWLLIRWTLSNPDNTVVIHGLASVKLGDRFLVAEGIVKENFVDTLSYALVWEDVSRQTKYGEKADSVVVSAGYKDGVAYRAFYASDMITDDWVEVGCDYNLLAKNQH